MILILFRTAFQTRSTDAKIIEIRYILMMKNLFNLSIVIRRLKGTMNVENLRPYFVASIFIGGCFVLFFAIINPIQKLIF